MVVHPGGSGEGEEECVSQEWEWGGCGPQKAQQTLLPAEATGWASDLDQTPSDTWDSA